MKAKEERFEGGDALRKAAQNRFGRSLTAEEWEVVDPDGWSAHPGVPYREADLEELLASIAELPSPSQPSAADRQRAQALAHQQRTAVDAKDFVRKQRIQLFDSPSPPFENDTTGAAEWIKAQDVSPETFLFNLRLAMPAELDDLEQLLWVRDWLTQVLPDQAPQGPEAREAVYNAFLEAADSPLRGIGHEVPVLAYLAPMPGGEFGIKRVRADDNTVLGKLREAAERLAKATGWTQLAAVHHILTGGVMSAPVSLHSQNRWGPESFGGATMRLEISDPFGVSADEVATAFAEGRKDISKPGEPPRRRGHASARRERVVVMVQETPKLSWAERWNLWNQRFPDELFSSAEAMRGVYRRARRS